MKSLIWILTAGAIVAGSGFVDRAEAGDRGRDRHGRQELRRDDHRTAVSRGQVRREEIRRDRYFYDRDVVVIRDYYRPRYRPVRNVRVVYAPNRYLPVGWRARLEPIPFALERRLPPVPRGYHRGYIDGYAVVYNPSGFILDAAFLF